MSVWRLITNKDDVQLSEDGETIDVLVERTEWGNEYIEIPVARIKALLNTAHNAKEG